MGVGAMLVVGGGTEVPIPEAARAAPSVVVT